MSAPRRRAETALEYALFAAILIMTVMGTFLYQAIARDPQLAPFTTYLILAYLVFLALAFSQLNTLHRKRTHATILDSAASVAEPRPSESVMREQELELERDYF